MVHVTSSEFELEFYEAIRILFVWKYTKITNLFNDFFFSWEKSATINESTTTHAFICQYTRCSPCGVYVSSTTPCVRELSDFIRNILTCVLKMILRFRNDTRVSNSWQNCHFWENFLFKCIVKHCWQDHMTNATGDHWKPLQAFYKQWFN